MDNNTAQERVHVKNLNALADTSIYDTNEDGDFTNRPNINIYATLSHETEDLLRILKTFADMLPAYRRALMGIYGEEKGAQRYRDMLPKLTELRNEFGLDLGLCVAERVAEWQDDYL